MRNIKTFGWYATQSLMLMSSAIVMAQTDKGPRQWFTMKATSDDSAEILIYDEIGQSFWGEDTLSAKDFDQKLKDLGDVKNLTLRINSPGGNVFDGVAIYNTIKNHKAKVTAHIDGIAASAASLIAMAADEIIMPENSFMLIHGASGLAWGNAETMRAMADDLDRINTSITATYAARTKQKPEAVAALMKEDRLMTAEEAVKLGYADKTSSAVKMAANYSMRLLSATAKQTIKTEMDKAAELPSSPAAESVEEPEAASPSPAPTNSTTNVVNIDDARKDERSKTLAYVNSVNETCALAGKPEKAAAYIKAGTSIEKVRAELIDARAREDEQTPTTGTHGTPSQRNPSARADAKSSWGKVTAKLNERAGHKKA